MVRRVVSFGLVCAAACAVVSLVRAAPGPNAAIPREPAALARTLVDTKAQLGRAVDDWVAGGDPRPTSDVTLGALYDQRIELLLAGRAGLGRAATVLVPPGDGA